MDEELVRTDGFGIKYGGVAYVVKRSLDDFTIKADTHFVKELTNPIKTMDGTVGSNNRKYLHDKLDEWIDKVIQGE